MKLFNLLGRSASFQARGRKRFGPFFVNWTERGPSSWGIKLWRVTKNVTHDTVTVDTPGPGSVRLGRRRRHPGRVRTRPGAEER